MRNQVQDLSFDAKTKTRVQNQDVEITTKPRPRLVPILPLLVPVS